MIVDLAESHATGCVAVVASLPEWFGYPGALEGVERAARTQRGFVDLEDGEVAGFVTTSPVFDETLEITYLAVHATHRRRGIGRLLVHAVRDFARAEGAASLCLLTLGPSSDSVYYAESVKFYRALGFWRTKELELVAWGGASALVMSGPLERIG